MKQPESFSIIEAAEGYFTVTPMPSEEELTDFYTNIYFQTQASATYQSEYSSGEIEQKRMRATTLIHALDLARSGSAGSSKRFAEVGCGEGFVLNAAAEAGYSVFGIEFSAYATQKFHPGLADRILTGNPFATMDRLVREGEKYDVCVLQNVLEHVREPILLLSKVRAILEDGGTAIITVPNDYSRPQLRAKELGFVQHDYWFLPPQHLQYFNIDNFKKLVVANGFEIIDAFSDFPIELFLYHPGSNYVRDRSLGKDAHRARVLLDLELAQRGVESYLQLCRAITGCGFGRNVSLVMSKIGLDAA